MARVFTYTIFLVMLTLVLQLFGMGVYGSTVLNKLGVKQGDLTAAYDVKSSDVWEKIFRVVLVVGVSAIAIGVLAKSQTENFIVLPLVGFVLVFFADVLINILSNNNFAGFPRIVLITILLPIIIGYAVTLVEWFRGNT